MIATGIKKQGIPQIRITERWLKSLNACADQRKVFRDEWPNGVIVSLGGLNRAAELKLDIDFLAKAILTAAALKTYEAATAPALKTYEAARAAALWKQIVLCELNEVGMSLVED